MEEFVRQYWPYGVVLWGVIGLIGAFMLEAEIEDLRRLEVVKGVLQEARKSPSRSSGVTVFDIHRAQRGLSEPEIRDALDYYRKRGKVRRIRPDSGIHSGRYIPGLSDQLPDRYEWIGEID